MMPKTFVIIALTAAIGFAAPKERAWEDGKFLDTRDNPYFNGQGAAALDGTKPITFVANDQFNVTQNAGASNTVYDHYVIEGRAAAYLVEFGHLKDYPKATVTLRKAMKFAVDKSKLWFLDDRGKEYETKILKTVPRAGALVTQAQPQTPTPVPAPAPVAVAPAPKPAQKEPVVVAKQEAPAVLKPAPAQEPVVAKPAETAKPETARQETVKQEAPKQDAPPTVKPAPMQESLVVAKAEIKEKPVVVKQPAKPEPTAKPEKPQVAAASASATLKDRPWQGGQLLSTASNRFFANIAYTTETDAATWTFVLGSDGKSTAFIHAAAPAGNPYIYDNYVIESEFCGYLLQRSRLKTVPPIRLVGTKPLRFAIEKNKIWIVDEDGKEWEAKIIKQIQKDPESEAQTPVRTAVR